MYKVVTIPVEEEAFIYHLLNAAERSYKAIANKLRNVGRQIQTYFNVIYRHYISRLVFICGKRDYQVL